MWFALTGDARLGRCATDHCGGQPTWRLESGGVGSNYCSGCKEGIESASFPKANVACPGCQARFVGDADRAEHAKECAALKSDATPAPPPGTYVGVGSTEYRPRVSGK